MMTFLLAGCGSNQVTTENTGSSDYRVCMITDAGDITDQSFNQTTYEASRDYCKAHDIDFTYKKPDGDTDYARTAMVDVAVAEGYNIIVMPGYVFAQTVVDTTFKYPDIKFIVLDMSAGDIGAAAVGNAYYDDPDAYNVADYYNTGNTYLAIYQEAIPGYFAGYTAVKLGYRHLGFLGGQAVPGVMRYGYGYVQGIDAAAKEMGITDDVTIEYAYGGQFYGSTEITAAMDTWYNNGTEVVFACGGGIFTSAAEAAAKVGGKVIGVDSDQSPIIDAYGAGMTVTSAMKSLTARSIPHWIPSSTTAHGRTMSAKWRISVLSPKTTCPRTMSDFRRTPHSWSWRFLRRSREHRRRKESRMIRDRDKIREKFLSGAVRNGKLPQML